MLKKSYPTSRRPNQSFPPSLVIFECPFHPWKPTSPHQCPLLPHPVPFSRPQLPRPSPGWQCLSWELLSFLTLAPLCSKLACTTARTGSFPASNVSMSHTVAGFSEPSSLSQDSRPSSDLQGRHHPVPAWLLVLHAPASHSVPGKRAPCRS